MPSWQPDLYRLLMAMPTPFAVVRGPEHRFSFANPLFAEHAYGRPFLGKTIREAFPDIAGQGLYEILDHVHETGERFVGNAIPIQLAGEPSRYYDVVCEPVRDAAGSIEDIMILGYEVTPQVQAMAAIQANQIRLAEVEERLRLALDAADIGTWSRDLSTGAIEWDARSRALFGVTDDAPMNIDRLLPLIHPDDRARVVRAIQDLAPRRYLGRQEVEYRTITGAWVHSIGRVQFDAEGRPLIMRGVLLDISERKRLFEERQIFFVLAENSRDFIGIADPMGRPIYLNPAGRKMVGLAPDAAVGDTTITDYYAEREGQRAQREILPEMLRNGRWSGETTFRNFLTGEEIPVSDEHFVLRDPESGILLGLGTISRDIRERRRREQERAQLLVAERAARAEAETANRMKDEFLAMLGHELRNPLAPILTALRLMRLRGVGNHEVEVIERQVVHLVHLVDDLLDVSRIARGEIELHPQRVELAEVLHDAIELTSPLLEQRQHQVEVDVPEHGLAVDGDRERLAQVFGNLLSNAAKYTPAHGHIRVTAETRNGSRVVRVRDDGIGIAPDILPRIFELFVQERQALDRGHGGLGLGLAIVKNVVTLHGGSVRAHSDGVGRGSEFVVTLPAAALHEAALAPQPAARAAVPAARRVLVVDDNEDAADLLGAALEAYGYETRVAYDAPSGLQAAAEFAPDVAVLDIGLPVMDGYELARRFRSDPRLAQARLIALTGYGQAADKERARAAGFDAHLVKPIGPDEVAAALAA